MKLRQPPTPVPLKKNFGHREVAVSVSRVPTIGGGEGFLISTSLKRLEEVYPSESRIYCDSLEEAEEHAREFYRQVFSRLFEEMRE